jgi:uncharacterized repeat protein (TIGR02543 family)
MRLQKTCIGQVVVLYLFYSTAALGQGQVVSFGDNTFGELGVSGTGSRTYLPQNPPIPGATALSASLGHTLAIKNDGTVWAWGSNQYGELGNTTNNGSNKANPAPTQVGGLSSIVAVASGSNHSLALKNDGTVWAWGSNQYGQLGNNSTNSANPTPAPIAGLTGIVAIASSYNHCLALKNDGTVWAWGYNYYGQLGNSTNNLTANPNPNPTQIAGLTGVVAIATGSQHSFAVTSDGYVQAWGNNVDGQLGSPASNTANPAPAPINGLSFITAIASGQNHGLAVKSDGTVWAWGYNNDGELGSGSANVYRYTPLPVIGLATSATSVAAGDLHSVALLQDGSVWTWGLNAWGQLGTSTNYFPSFSANPTPSQVAGLTGIQGITAGSLDTYAFTPAPVTITITIPSSGVSLTVTGNGCQPGTYNSSTTFNTSPGTVCQLNVTSQYPSGTGTQDVLSSWSDGSTNANRTFTVPPINTILTAQYKTQYLLTVAASPAGSGTVSGGGYYDYNSSVPVTAAANAGYVFTNWTGPVTAPTNASTTVTMSGPQTVTANFIIPIINVTASVTAADKYYDRTAVASIKSCTLAGVAPADQANVTCSVGSASFSDANAGSGKTVSATGITLNLTGSAVGHYGLTSTSAAIAATIMQAPLTASVTAANKVYDATATATINNCTPSGVIPGDAITCSAANGAFAFANAGTWTVTASGITLSGGAAGNYNLNPNTATATATISKATATMSEAAPAASIYGQTVQVTATLTPPTGTAPTGQVTLYYVANATTYYICSNGTTSLVSCNVPVSFNGTNYVATVAVNRLAVGADTITASYSGDGNFFGNSSSASVTVSPAAAAISLTKSADPSVYGGPIALTVRVTDNTPNSVAVPSGTVTLTFKLNPTDTASYNICGDGSISLAPCASGITLSPDATDTSGKTAVVTVMPTRLPAGAYSVNASYPGDGNFNANGPFTLMQTVTQRPISVTASSDTKFYDGTAISNAIPSLAPGSLANGDVANFTQSFDSRNAGPRVLTPSGVVNDGNGGKNYSYTFNTTGGTINKATLTITAATNTKTFDGTVSAAAVPTYFGLISGDTVTGLAETYNTPSSGSGKTLSVSAYTVSDGNGGGNYAVTAVPVNTGVINQYPEVGNLLLALPEQGYSDKEAFIVSLPVASVGGESAAGTASIYICPSGATSTGPACQNMTPAPVPLVRVLNALVGAATFDLNETVSGALAPGPHVVVAVFTGGPDFSLNAPTAPLQIDKELTLPTGDTLYTGATTYSAPSGYNNNATLSLAVTVTDPCGNYPAGYAVCGDVSKGTVTFNVVNGTTLTPIPGATNLPIGLVTPGNTTVGTAAAVVKVRPGRDGTIAIQVTVSNYFIGGDPSQSTIIVLTQSNVPNQMTIKGSQLAQSSGGLFRGGSGQLTELDGDVSKSGSSAKGGLTAQIVSMYKPDGTLDTTAHTYQVQTNNIATFSQISSGAAVFTANASIQDITNSNSSVLVDGSAIVQLTACEAGASCPGGPASVGPTGAIGFQVSSSKTGGLWYSSNWNGKQTVPLNAAAGTVQID